MESQWQLHETYFITGGLGALGLRVARWLADNGAKYIVLMSRSAASDQKSESIEALRAKDPARPDHASGGARPPQPKRMGSSPAEVSQENNKPNVSRLEVAVIQGDVADERHSEYFSDGRALDAVITAGDRPCADAAG